MSIFNEEGKEVSFSDLEKNLEYYFTVIPSSRNFRIPRQPHRRFYEFKMVKLWLRNRVSVPFYVSNDHLGFIITKDGNLWYKAKYDVAIRHYGSRENFIRHVKFAYQERKSNG